MSSGFHLFATDVNEGSRDVGWLKFNGENGSGLQEKNCVARFQGSEKSAVKTHETKIIY